MYIFSFLNYSIILLLNSILSLSLIFNIYSFAYKLNLKRLSPFSNWTKEYTQDFAEFALDFAAAAYSKDPSACLAKHKAVLEIRKQIPCDTIYDEVAL